MPCGIEFDRSPLGSRERFLLSRLRRKCAIRQRVKPLRLDERPAPRCAGPLH